MNAKQRKQIKKLKIHIINTGIDFLDEALVDLENGKRTIADTREELKEIKQFLRKNKI